jgi:glycosidase
MGSNPNYNTRKPTGEEFNLMKLMIFFQMTYIGAPYIYYGDEAGMWGANDPDCRKPMLWSDIDYQSEIYLPDHSKKEFSDSVNFDKELFEFYKQMIQIRNDYEELQLGNFKELLIDDDAEVYIFSRQLEHKGTIKEIIVAINKGEQLQPVTLATDHKEYYTDLLDTKIKVDVNNGCILLELQPKTGRLFLRDYYKE